MVDYMPQDEYFEWDDIIPCRTPFEVTESGIETQTLEYRRNTFTFEDDESSDSHDFQWSEADTETSASTTTIQRSFTFQSFNESGKEDFSIAFPSYEGCEYDPSDRVEVIDIGLGGIETAKPIVDDHHAPAVPTIATLHPDCMNTRPKPFERATITETRDCEALEVQPFGNVNYLLHQWREEDVSASWKHVVSKRKTWSEEVSSLDLSDWKRHSVVRRLENASWRTWSKLRFGLRTVNPKTINWRKHCDTTCLYGPLSVCSSSSPCLSRDTRTPSSKSDTSTTTRKSILKKPTTSDILCRGSLLSYMVSSSFQRTLMQGRSLSDNSPLTHLQLAPRHIEFRTPKSTLFNSCSGAQQMPKPRRSVTFLPEVRQYVIVIPIGDRKIQRTVKKTKSTTLKENAPLKLVEPVESQLVSEPSYWSPQTLWSQNQNSVQDQERGASSDKKDAEWPWLGIIGEEVIDNEPSIGEGSLTYYYGNQHFHSDKQTQISSPESTSTTPPLHFDTGVVVEDPIDYLLPSTSDSSVGSLSPPSSSEELGSDGLCSSTSEDSSDDDIFGIASPPLVRDHVVRDEKFGGEVRGLGMDIGIMDDERHRLYEQVMEEFNLEY